MYARVLVFIPIRSKTSPFFDYSIPPEMADAVGPGVLVVVPLRTQVLPGIVMALTDAPAVPETRPIDRVLDPEPVLNATQLEMARWMARETLAPMHKCVQAMLPPGMRPRAYLRLTPLIGHVPEGLPAPAEALLALLIERGPLKSSQIKRALRDIDVRRGRQALKKRGLVKVDRLLHLPRIQPRRVRMVQLAAPRERWDSRMERLRRRDLYHSILTFLAGEEHPVEVHVVYAETGAQSHHIKMLEERGLIALSHEEEFRDPLSDMVYTPDAPPPLIPGQRAVWEALAPLLDPDAPARPPALLLGVTGSGKTELYMRATAKVLAQGRQAIILVPEISLTPQTVRRFALRFPGQVGLWHSSMSDGARFDTWRRVRSGDLAVVVGARSAVFLPFPDLGLIVMDEEEDTSYKQGRTPYYHTRRVAEALARRTDALLLMGSATPSLEAYNHASAGRYRLFELPRRVLGHRRRIAAWRKLLHLASNRYRPVPEAEEASTIDLPPVEVVDMRAELKAGNRSIFSRALQQAVDAALSREEQVLLFLNRRGTSTYVFCRDCGWVATCPRCDIPLTYHAGISRLLCHRCGHGRRQVRRCPACGSKKVRAFGLGTEGLEAQVAERWPEARLVRWDRDVARSHAAHTALMGRFARGEADILVGTQMVARGLDIPKVTVVGVISADTALNLPDFRAAERTFQLLLQVAGRAGRGILGGRVVVQTYHPTHYAIRYAAAHDYRGFAKRELAFRQRAGYPPFVRMARLVYSHTQPDRAQEGAERFAHTLREALARAGKPPSDLIGPAPAFFARVRGRYRWQILLRSDDPAAFLRSVDIPAGWLVDVDPVDVL